MKQIWRKVEKYDAKNVSENRDSPGRSKERDVYRCLKKQCRIK